MTMVDTSVVRVRHVSSCVQGDKSRPIDTPLSLSPPRVNTLEDDPSIGVDYLSEI